MYKLESDTVVVIYSLLTSDKRTSSSWLFFFFLPDSQHLHQWSRAVQNYPITSLHNSSSHSLCAGYQGDSEVKSGKWSNGLAWVFLFFFFKCIIYFISFLSLLTSWEYNITTWTNDCAERFCAVCSMLKSNHVSWSPSSQLFSHFLSLWFHNSWTDASILPLARNLSAVTGKCFFRGSSTQPETALNNELTLIQVG